MPSRAALVGLSWQCPLIQRLALVAAVLHNQRSRKVPMKSTLPSDSATAGPRRRVSQQANRAVAPSEPSPPGVLVVDADAHVRAALQACLEHLGFRVWSAASGREAIEVYGICGGKIGLVLLEMQLAGLDGQQTLAQLRSLDPEVRGCYMKADHVSGETRLIPDVVVLPKPFDVCKVAPLLRDLARPGGSR
jgi:CheY-like chemotaxis protein